MKAGVIIAARTASTRLPGKALLPLMNTPMAIFLLRRLRTSKLAGGIYFATTDLRSDDNLARLALNEGIPVFRGSSSDVVQRFVMAARAFGCNEQVVRVTADCPFLDAETLDHCLQQTGSLSEHTMASTKGLFPVGLDYEIYHASALEKVHESGALSPEDREHLTKYFYDHPELYKVLPLSPRPEWEIAGQTFTVDTEADYEKATAFVQKFNDATFSTAQLVASLK